VFKNQVLVKLIGELAVHGRLVTPMIESVVIRRKTVSPNSTIDK